jgi:hypothetical protein
MIWQCSCFNFKKRVKRWLRRAPQRAHRSHVASGCAMPGQRCDHVWFSIGLLVERWGICSSLTFLEPRCCLSWCMSRPRACAFFSPWWPLPSTTLGFGYGSVLPPRFAGGGLSATLSASTCCHPISRAPVLRSSVRAARAVVLGPSGMCGRATKALSSVYREMLHLRTALDRRVERHFASARPHGSPSLFFDNLRPRSVCFCRC